MKKTVSVFLTVLMVMLLTSCEKNVELTENNVEEYLNFKVSYGEKETYKKSGFIFNNQNVNLDIYPVASGTFENVEVRLAITCPYPWSVSSSDSAHQEDHDNLMRVTIKLPADGKYSEVHRI